VSGVAESTKSASPRHECAYWTERNIPGIFGYPASKIRFIASEARQSGKTPKNAGLSRRFAPRDDACLL